MHGWMDGYTEGERERERERARERERKTHTQRTIISLAEALVPIFRRPNRGGGGSRHRCVEEEEEKERWGKGGLGRRSFSFVFNDITKGSRAWCVYVCVCDLL
jgi:hypothetical protein